MTPKHFLTIISLCAPFCLLLAACSTPSEPINLNDGSKGYRITCGGAYATTGSCYEKAGSICGNKGYTVVHENSIAPPADANYFWNASAFETIIKCNGDK